jgi:hypothetical protein
VTEPELREAVSRHWAIDDVRSAVIYAHVPDIPDAPFALPAHDTTRRADRRCPRTCSPPTKKVDAGSMSPSGDVKYFHRVPAPPLGHFVASIWYAENARAHELELFLPTGQVDLIINVHDGRLVRYEVDELDNARRYLGPVVSGAHSRPYVIHTGQQASLLGVKFTVGCAREVLGLALDVLSRNL